MKTQKKSRSGSKQSFILCSDGLYTSIRLTRKLAQALYCTECMGFESNPADCTSRFCPHYPFRCKTLQNRTGKYTRAEAMIMANEQE